MKKYFFAGTIFLAAIFSSCVLQKPNEDSKQSRTVTVSGTGTVGVQADIATINMAVVTSNRSVVEASRLNAEAVAKVRADLIEAGHSADSIVTDGYTINQDVSYRNGLPIRGDYRVSNSMHIVVRNISNIGNAIDIAVNAGANEFSSIDFSVNDMEGALREARTQAVKQAYEAANLMAKTAGAELGQIVSIAEERNDGFRSVMNNSAKMAMDLAAGESTMVSPGKQIVSVTVSCVYEIQ